MSSISIITDFQNIFTGNTKAYGVHEYKFSKKGDKEQGTSYTKPYPVTFSLYEKHLKGEKGLGIIPITHSNLCNFAVIDIDVYNEKVDKYVHIVYKYNIPILPFRTKSGGLHLFMFVKPAISAKKIRNYMYGFVTILGLNIKTEVFPKQNILKNDSVGSWINLPYYNCNDTKQYLYGPNKEKLPIEIAINEIKKKTQNEETVAEFFDNIPLNDAPPCLQTIYLFSDTDNRNEYLFSLAAYFKVKYGDDFEQKVAEANNFLSKPLSIKELSDTVIASHKKRNYSYRCAEPPLAYFCNKKICSNRKYGLGGDEINQLSYGAFVQVRSDPPYYVWTINEKQLKFFSELDIMLQQRFRQLCFRELHILPFRLKELKWTKIINNVLKNVITTKVDEGDDISPGALFKEYLYEFLEKRVAAKNKEQILVDRVFKDEEKKCYIFKSAKLIDFLLYQKQFRSFKAVEIHARLKDMGGMAMRYYINKVMQRIRVWSLPFKCVEEFVTKDEVNIDIKLDLREDLDKEPF